MEESLNEKIKEIDVFKKELKELKTNTNNKIKKLQNELETCAKNIPNEKSKKSKHDNTKNTTNDEIIEKYKLDIFNKESIIMEQIVIIDSLNSNIVNINKTNHTQQLKINELDTLITESNKSIIESNKLITESNKSIEIFKKKIIYLTEIIDNHKIDEHNELLINYQIKTNEMEKHIIELNKQIENNINSIEIIENYKSAITNNYSVISELHTKIDMLNSLISHTNDKYNKTIILLQEYEIKNKELLHTIKEQSKYYIF